MRFVLAVLAVAPVAGTASATPRTAPAHPCRAALPRGPSVPASLVIWDDCGVFRLERDGRLRRLRRHWLAYHGGGTGRRFGADLHAPRDLPHRPARAGTARGAWPRDLHPRVHPLGPAARRRAARDPRDRPRRQRASSLPLRTETRIRLRREARRPLLRHRVRILGRGARGTCPYSPPRSRKRHLAKSRRVGLLVWLARHSLVVTGRTGAVVASSRWPRALGSVDLGVYASSDRTLFAYRVTLARPSKRDTSAAVFVLHRGAHVAGLLVRHRPARPGCGGVPGSLGWDGHHLLYNFGDGRVAVFNLDSGSRTSLTVFAETIPRREPGESVTFAWASSFAR